MKHLLTLAIMAIVVGGCRKEVVVEETGWETRIRNALQDSASSNATIDYNHINRIRLNADFSYYVLYKAGSPGSFWVLLVQGDYVIKRGAFVELAIDKAPVANPYLVNGTIRISSLSGQELVFSTVRNGRIKAFYESKAKRQAREGLMTAPPVELPPEYTTLPEVVVVGTRSTEGKVSYSTWMSLSAPIDGGGGGYYAPVGGAPQPDPGGGGGGGTYDGGAILIDQEAAVNNPSIDVLRYLACFDKLPDAGANCSIEIFADIPVDTNSNMLLEWQTGSPGHVFLQLKKVVGGKTIAQNIGFYPASGWKVAFTNAPVTGKFVDNGHHEFNASLAMPVTPDKFRRVLAEIKYLAARVRYDIDEYNCTDFALDIFNTARAEPLDIPLYNIPGGMAVLGTRTPQGLYNQLAAMKRSNANESKNITMPGVKGFAGGSNGPCN